MCYLFFCNLPNKFSWSHGWLGEKEQFTYLELLKFELKLSKSWIDILSDGYGHLRVMLLTVTVLS